MPAEVSITKTDELFTGKDKVLAFTVVDSAGVAVNITGWALRWVLELKPFPGRSTGWLVSKTVGSGISITDGAGGVCQVTIDDTDTDTFDGSDTPDYYHELTRTDAGNEDVLAYGPVVLRQSPTR
jgi:hypothetical protein